NRTGDSSAGILDQLLGFVARMTSKRSGEYERLRRKLCTAFPLLASKLQSRRAQTRNQFAVVLFEEELANTCRDPWADFLHFLQSQYRFFLRQSCRFYQFVHRAEVFG